MEWKFRNHQKVQALQAEKSLKEQMPKQKKLTKNYVTNILETRKTGSKTLMEKIYPVQKNDTKHRPQ